VDASERQTAFPQRCWPIHFDVAVRSFFAHNNLAGGGSHLSETGGSFGKTPAATNESFQEEGSGQQGANSGAAQPMDQVFGRAFGLEGATDSERA